MSFYSFVYQIRRTYNVRSVSAEISVEPSEHGNGLVVCVSVCPPQGKERRLQVVAVRDHLAVHVLSKYPRPKVIGAGS